MIDKELLDILACPSRLPDGQACRGDIRYDSPDEKLTCLKCGRRYPIREGIPIMLEEESRLPDGQAERPH